MPGKAPLRRLRVRILEESSILRHYLWKYRRFVAIGLISLVVLDASEVLPPMILKDAVDATVERKPVVFLLYLALGYFGVAILQAICRYGWRMYLIRSSFLGSRDLRSRYAHHLFGLGASFFDRSRIGDLMSLATNDVQAVRMSLGPGLLVLADALFCFLAIPPAMFYLSPRLTLISFIPLPVIPFIVLRNEREVHKRFERVQECFSELSALTQEGLSGIRVIKGFAQEHTQVSRLRTVGEKYMKLSLHLARVQTAFGPTLDFVMSVGLALLLYFGGRLVIQGQGHALGMTAADGVSLGTFIAFQRYIQKMVWPMAAIGMAASHYQRGVSSSIRLKESFAESTDVGDRSNPQLPEGYVPGGSWKTRGAIEFRNLSFAFTRDSREVLRGISFAIEPGERVALVGMIGSGKSALLSLLPRLYPVKRGSILIDQVDIQDWPLEELRRQVGYVSQDVFLFSETVAENIVFGLTEWVSGAQPAESASRLACVHEDVLGWIGGYKTRLGERGVNLSGGQKQRLTIARAVAKQPSILVLDDALSSVDVQTEEKILQGLRARPGRNTELIAAHRISTVKDADRILVLEEGRVSQMGTHSRLIQDRAGSYYRFYEQQRLKEDLENYGETLDILRKADSLIDARSELSL